MISVFEVDHHAGGREPPRVNRVSKIVNFVLVDPAEEPVGLPKPGIDIGNPALYVFFPDAERVESGGEKAKVMRCGNHGVHSALPHWVMDEIAELNPAHPTIAMLKREGAW